MKENCEYLIDLCREVCLNLPKETKESISKEHCSYIMLISYFIIILFCTNNKVFPFTMSVLIYCAGHCTCLLRHCWEHWYIIMLQLTNLSITSWHTNACVRFMCVWFWCFAHIVSVCMWDLHRLEGLREAYSADSEAEDGLSSLGSELWAALECRWISVGLGSVEATPGLDNQVSHIMWYIFIYR